MPATPFQAIRGALAAIASIACLALAASAWSQSDASALGGAAQGIDIIYIGNDPAFGTGVPPVPGRSANEQAEDFIDQRLASFEILLDKLSRTVAAGRTRLGLGTREIPVVEAVDEDHSKGFCDQDRG